MDPKLESGIGLQYGLEFFYMLVIPNADRHKRGAAQDLELSGQGLLARCRPDEQALLYSLPRDAIKDAKVNH